MSRPKSLPFVVIAAFVIVAGCSSSDTTPPPLDEPEPDATEQSDRTPELEVESIADGLANPWDLVELPGGELMFTERDLKRVSILDESGDRRTVLEDPEGMWNSGETGLMSIELPPDFEETGEFITCHGYMAGGTQDVRVVRWSLNEGRTEATKAVDLVTGLPSTSGRHGGCSMAIGADDALYIGTGDAATGENPQDLTSGGGKVLRVDPATGDGLEDNPYADEDDEMQQRVWSYGHRNVQGLSFNADGDLYAAEHGPRVDDEINRIEAGGNYGWNPVPGYNESVPMTDPELPGNVVEASWESGEATIAVSGAAFLRGDAWGALEGNLAVTALKGEQMRFMAFSDNGELEDERTVEPFDGEFGRLRGLTLGADGSLFVTTSNGQDDKILKATPS